jgi:hypothetical protein
VRVCWMPCAEGSRQLILCLVRPMRAFIFSLALTVGAVFADTPLGPPEVVNTWSVDHSAIAKSDPATNRTTVSTMSLNGAPTRVLWTYPQWFRTFEVAPGGAAIVVEEVGLLPLDAGGDLVLLTFIVRGKIVRRVTVAELLGPSPKFERTASHLSWGHGLHGIDRNGFALVDTVAGFFIFEAETGKCVFPKKA